MAFFLLVGRKSEFRIEIMTAMAGKMLSTNWSKLSTEVYRTAFRLRGCIWDLYKYIPRFAADPSGRTG
jgi:hypothetical protein